MSKEEKLTKKLQSDIAKLPGTPGVYFFLGPKKEIMYIGKATSLKSRVRSYFAKDIREKRSALIEKMVLDAQAIKFQKTESVLEALILEAALIQKHLPPYNTDGKDQKTWNFVVITKEDFPKVLVMRQREIEFSTEIKIKEKFGPFTHGYELREALKIIRKIFPYRDSKCVPLSGKPCFNYQIGLCPGVCVGKISKNEYAKTVRHISLFFQGKKASLIKSLTKQMKECAKQKKFEKAGEIKRKISALSHIQDIAMIKDVYNVNEADGRNFRIESYDISHTSGVEIVGVMTVMEYGAPKKQDYRKFNIRGQQGSDDVRALREVLRRRFNHPEWPVPDLIVIDGGTGQVNGARLELETLGIKIPTIGVVKDERHKPKDFVGTDLAKTLALQHEKEVLLANSEAHRFAITFHRKRLHKLP
jgi:excinuclease ABC subunit C